MLILFFTTCDFQVSLTFGEVMIRKINKFGSFKPQNRVGYSPYILRSSQTTINFFKRCTYENMGAFCLSENTFFFSNRGRNKILSFLIHSVFNFSHKRETQMRKFTLFGLSWFNSKLELSQPSSGFKGFCSEVGIIYLL